MKTKQDSVTGWQGRVTLDGNRQGRPPYRGDVWWRDLNTEKISGRGRMEENSTERKARSRSACLKQAERPIQTDQSK